MAYCSIDIGRRDYPFDVSERCGRASSKLLSCCDRLARKFPHLVLDRFGLLDDNPAKDRLPRRTSEGLAACSVARAGELGERVICWSGGIDSSFIIACYLLAKVPFGVAYNDASVASPQGGIILRHLERLKVPLFRMRLLSDYALLERSVTGDGADLLFAPGRHDLVPDAPAPGGLKFPLEAALEHVYAGQGLYARLLAYAGRLGVRGRREEGLVRALRFGCFYYFKRDYFRAVTGAGEDRMIPFFDTLRFMDIAWSSFRDAVYEDGRKLACRRLVAEAFGDRQLFTLMARNPSAYLRPSNLGCRL